MRVSNKPMMINRHRHHMLLFRHICSFRGVGSCCSASALVEASAATGRATGPACSTHQHLICRTHHHHHAGPRQPLQSRCIQTKATSSSPTGINSNRADFKATPIIPSILSHIEKIGVGIRPKPSRSRRPRKSKRPSKDDNITDNEFTLDEYEEREYFKQSRMISRHSSPKSSRQQSNGSKSKTDAHGKKSPNNSKHDSNPDSDGGKNNNRVVGAHWLPPPPFSTYTKGSSVTSTSITRQRRPVKILGSAASLSDDLPFESPNLSEVALAGRSNVGKSTLLNALLYGNIDINLSPRQYQRGRTPEGAKLPKGVKAVTSDKPGETKRMSFYQLTADVAVSNNDNNDSSIADDVLVEKDVVAADEKHQEQQYLKYSLVFVDLPGFGFAFAKEEKTKEWNELMHHYLLERRSLKRILLLLDARHGFKKADFEFLDMLQEGLMMRNQQEQSSSQSEEEKSSGDGGGRGRQRKMKKRKRRELPPIQIVLTKCDLVKQVDLARRVVVVRQQLSDALAREPSSLPVMLVSALGGLGFNNIRGVEQQPMGGVLELQKELSSLVPVSKINVKKTK